MKSNSLQELYKLLRKKEITKYYKDGELKELKSYINNELECCNYLSSVKEYFKEKQSDSPVISIVIPAYNEQYEILMTLLSLTLLDVSRYPVEILIVDNNSSDYTKRIIECCGVKYVSCVDQGVQYARRKGFQTVSSGSRYLWFLDADTRLTKPIKNENDVAPNTLQHINCYMDFISKNSSYVALSSCSVLELESRLYKFINKMTLFFRVRKNRYSCFSGANQFFDLGVLRDSGAMVTDVEFGEDHNRVYNLARYIKKNKLKLNIASVIKDKNIGIPVYTSGRRFFKNKDLFLHYLYTLRNRFYRVEYIQERDEYGYPVYKKNKDFKNVRL